MFSILPNCLNWQQNHDTLWTRVPVCMDWGTWCVCVCVCVLERERERITHWLQLLFKQNLLEVNSHTVNPMLSFSLMHCSCTLQFTKHAILLYHTAYTSKKKRKFNLRFTPTESLIHSQILLNWRTCQHGHSFQSQTSHSRASSALFFHWVVTLFPYHVFLRFGKPAVIRN